MRWETTVGCDFVISARIGMILTNIAGGLFMKNREKVRAAIEALRLHQWIKNGFVLAAPAFAKQLTIPKQAVAAALAFTVFCLASSAVYLLNDLVDLRRDLLHPLKKNRPVASGRLPRGAALALAAGLAIAAFTIAGLTLPLAALAVLTAYVITNVLYTFLFKHVVILDVMFIALGFLLRVMMGACATTVLPSYWLLLCTVNVSLFLGFTKRRAELIALESNAQAHREVLEHYSHGFLDQMIAIVTGATLVCYILYTVDARTVETFGTRYLVATVPFVLYGGFRYLYLSYHKSGGGNPAKAILTDTPFLVNLFLWALACLAIIYWGAELESRMPWP